MRKILSVIFFLSFFLVPTTQSQAKSESWYFHLAAGYAIPQYPDSLESVVDFASNNGYSNMPIYFDIGFYWPAFSKSSILGVALPGYIDMYSGPTTLQLIQSDICASFMHFFGKEVGNGLYIRLDVGFAMEQIMESNGAFAIAASSGMGYAARAGTGVGFNVSDGTRMLIEAAAGYSKIEGENYIDYSFSLGFLF